MRGGQYQKLSETDKIKVNASVGLRLGFNTPTLRFPAKRLQVRKDRSAILNSRQKAADSRQSPQTKLNRLGQTSYINVCLPPSVVCRDPSNRLPIVLIAERSTTKPHDLIQARSASEWIDSVSDPLIRASCLYCLSPKSAANNDRNAISSSWIAPRSFQPAPKCFDRGAINDK